MERTCYFVLLFVVFAGIAYGELDDEFDACMHQEVCLEEGGKNQTMFCLEKLGKTDSDWCLNFFKEWLTDTGLTFWKLTEIACTDPDKGSAAMNDYYDKRKEYEKEKPVNGDDEAALIATRDCFMTMINQCKMRNKFLG